MATLQENLKLFYLGLKNGEPFLYKNKDLTTHALIIGMTGSGKTGLGVSLLEEACIDNIPSIVIDPKGDLTNLCLAFENLSASDFLPFIDENEAASKGVSTQELAATTAGEWQKGLESTFQSKERVKLFKNSADFRIYTPKSSAGLGVSLLSDFEAPIGLDDESLNNYVAAITSSVLSLVGIDGEDLSAPEVLLIQTIFYSNFRDGLNVSITELISQIMSPKFTKIGVFDVNSFFPSEKRKTLAMKINALLASPSFSKWCEGEKLEIGKMLFNAEGKARCNIFTISHLNDSERMFFVTILLNEVIRWMRTTSGTSALRAVLYMDEIFGFFPPNSNPPSKTPMLTLLKQARAFGLGCVLSTQNPVDLDYKGLSNIGTWFIGRLQTAQDKERVISGLVGVGKGEFDKTELEHTISNLQKRNFLVKNINEDALSVISTRFALSYLKGPLSSEQISKLMQNKKIHVTDSVNSLSRSLNSDVNSQQNYQKPMISQNIAEFYDFSGANSELKPYLWASAKVRFNEKDLDFTREFSFCFALEDAKETIWEEASENSNIHMQDETQENYAYAEIPSYIANAKDLKNEAKNFKEFLYRNASLELFSALGLNSNPGESKEEFIMRLQDRCNEILEEKTSEFQAKFDKEKAKIEERLFRAQDKLEKEKSEAKSKGIEAAINIGISVIGAFFGNKVLTRTNASKLASGARSANRVWDAKTDVDNAQESIKRINADLDEFTQNAQTEFEKLKQTYDARNIQIEIKKISPKKSDIFGEKIALLWRNV